MEKSLVFFFYKSTYLWKKVFISRYEMIIFTYKSWSVNSGRLTLYLRSKVTRGDSFDFKMLLTIFRLQEQSLWQVRCSLFLKKWDLQLFFANKSVLPSQLTSLTEKSLANCNFSKKDILQIIGKILEYSNKAHGHDMISICK